MNNETTRLLRYLRGSRNESVAVFDIGTRATRLLVAPAEVPSTEWFSEYFFNARHLSLLGGEVGRFERNLEVDKSNSLDHAIQFIGEYTRLLVENGVRKDNIHAIGTAVFRWLENQSEVLNLIQQKTGLDVRVLSDRDEAQMSLAGIAFTYNKRPGGPAIGSNDFIMLIDQGGGSTEVSYSTADGRDADLHSFDDFGTVALRHKFFTMGVDGRVDPASNRRRIVTQLERIWSLAEEEINNWEGYPGLLGRTLHVYGMGSAISKCYPGTSNFKIHNRVCTIDRIKEVLEWTGNELDYSNQQILTLWKRYKEEEDFIERDRQNNLENRLLALYGLPVFAKFLEKFGVSELRICGYGLRYAYYLWKYHYRVAD